VGWQLLFMALTVGIVMVGIQKGIERAARILMPTLFVLVLALAVWALTLEDAAEGYSFYLMPDPGEFLAPTVIGSAMGQAFFSLSLGMGAMLTFASYLSRDTNLGGESVTISFADFSAAFVAGLMVSPVIFALGLQDQVSESTVGALFIALPGAFDAMGTMGRVVGTSSSWRWRWGRSPRPSRSWRWSPPRSSTSSGRPGRTPPSGWGLIGLAGLASAVSTDLLGLLDQIAGDLFLVILFVLWFSAQDAWTKILVFVGEGG